MIITIKQLNEKYKVVKIDYIPGQNEVSQNSLSQ